MSFNKLTGRIFIIIFSFVAVFLIGRAIWNATSAAAVERYLKKAAAAGLPLKFADLGPPCPAGESAAPLWKAADALLDVEYARKAYKGHPFEDWLNGREADEKIIAAYESSIAKNRRPIDLYLESSDRTCGRDPERKSIFNYTQDGTKRLWAARLIAAEAVLRARAGDIKGGLDECLKGLKLVRLSLDEPSLINSLISIASMKFVVVSLNRIVDGKAVDPENLRPFFSVLSSGNWYEAFRRHVKAERVAALETVEAVLETGYVDVGEAAPKNVKASFWLFRPVLQSQFVRYLTRFDDMERIYGLPRTERASAILEFDRRAENPGWLDKLAVGLLPEALRLGDPKIGAAVLKESTLEALMDTARIGLAARIFRMREGRWPESVAALVPEFLEKEPLDPFTEKPYVYRAGEAGLLVYSVGANLKDENGRGTHMITQLVMPKDDDWAWRDSFKN